MDGKTATQRVRVLLAWIPTDRLQMVPADMIHLADRAVLGNDEAGAVIRRQLAQMTECLGHDPEQVIPDDLRDRGFGILLSQYFQIAAGLRAERLGEGTLQVVPERWGKRGAEIVMIDGLPLSRHNDFMIGSDEDASGRTIRDQ